MSQLALGLARPHPDMPFAVSYGLGLDSTAMLVGLADRGIRPDIITFADVGSEKPETYAYLPVIDAWLESVGFPPVTVCRYEPVRATYRTLHDNCEQKSMLPSPAYGGKSCSMKFKVDVQHNHLKGYPAAGKRPAHGGWAPAQEAWDAGGKVLRAIGYDAGKKDSRRGARLASKKAAREPGAVPSKYEVLYEYWYPLQDWGWDRAESAAAIRRAGLPVPVKSACWMCPVSKPEELVWLAHHHPDLFARALRMEDAARPSFKKTEGFWRKTRKRDGRPGSWKLWAVDEGLVTLTTDDPLGPFVVADHVLSCPEEDRPAHPDLELIELESEMIALPVLD